MTQHVLDTSRNSVVETDTDVVFTCSTCGLAIGFNKPGIGEPSVVPVVGHPDDDWHPPESFLTRTHECPG
jgi:hypothetical protein